MELFSGEKYERLESIFSCDEDIASLVSEPGYTHAIGRRHRRAMRKLAFRWIAELQEDFDKSYKQDLAMLANFKVEHADLYRSLRRLRFSFGTKALLFKTRLLWGFPSRDDARNLRTIFEELIGYGCIIRQDLNIPDCFGS